MVNLRETELWVTVKLSIFAIAAVVAFRAFCNAVANSAKVAYAPGMMTNSW